MTLLPADVRLRLAMALIVILAVSQLGTLLAAVIALAGAVLVVLVAGTGAPIWHRLLHVEAFMILLFLSLPFTMAGEPALQIGPLIASWEGIGRAALIAAKVTASVLLAFAFLNRAEPVRLGAALRSMRVPEPLVRMFVLMVRYLSVIGDEARRGQEAMRARAFRAGSNRHTWRSYGNLAGMLLLRALDRAQRVEDAMLCRGHSGRFPWQAPPRLGPGDWAWIGAAAGAAMIITAIDRL